MENKKGFSILKFFIVFICIIFIALSLSVNIMFNRKHTPNLFGYHIYILNNKDMGELLPEGTALISKDAKDLEINQGDIILCHLNGSDDVIIRTVYKTTYDEATGIANYYLSTANANDDNSVTDFIPKENIIALCTGYPQNINLGRWINFTLNIKGIAIQLIFPSILLVIFLIAKIASSKENDDDDEDFSFSNEEEKEKKKGKPAPVFKSSEIKESPLFVDPSPEDYSSDELERKKQSIAEHFSHKEVNPNSPYQKEKERTMQFKALKAAENATKNSSLPEKKKTQVDVTETFTAPQKIQTEPAAPPDALLAEMQKRTAKAEEDAQKAAAEKVAPIPPTPPRKSSSPDINDIIKKSETQAKNKEVSTMSVDDLLKMIEDEKNKL